MIVTSVLRKIRPRSGPSKIERARAEIAGLKQKLEDVPYKEREKLVGQYGIRIGYKDLDMLQMQARIRAIEPSLTIGRENFRWVFYSGRALSQAQINRIEQRLGFRLEKG